MKLSAFLKDKKQTSFEVANVTFEMTEARDGQPAQKVAILHLANPIKLVQSSQTFTDEATGESVRNEAYDVENVRIVERDFDTDGIDIDENGKPAKVPELEPETELEIERFAAAKRRKELSLILSGKMKPTDSIELKKLFLGE